MEDDEVDASPVRHPVQESRYDTAPETRPQRPMTARPRPRPIREVVEDDDPPGAVGGRPVGGYYQRQVTEQEQGVGRQAQQLLEIFIMDRCERDQLPRQSNRLIQDNVCEQVGSTQEKQTATRHDEEYLDDVAITLRTIGDQLSQDYELNSLIDMVPIQSPREIFFKVCKQMFQDGQFNWGRVVALFYFAYRLIAKAIQKSAESVPWIKDIMRWVMDFFYDYIAWWIVQRGGWFMIREYWGTRGGTLGALAVMALVSIFYTLWKQT